MIWSLRWRLTAAFLFVSLLGIGIAAVLTHTVTRSEFRKLDAQQRGEEFSGFVTDYYAEHGTLEGFDAYLKSPSGPRPAMQTPPAGQGQPGGQQGQPPAGQQGQPGGQGQPPGGQGQPQQAGKFLLVDLNGIAQTNAAPKRIGDSIDAATLSRGFPLYVDDVQIGTLVDMEDVQLGSAQQEFINHTDQALFIATLIAGAVSFLAGALLAGGLTNPLTRLTHAIAAFGQEAEPTPIKAPTRGEIGQLVRAFNSMAADLARSNHLRKQMTADIAHELRSPLAVINGYLEGMRDGTLPPTPERYEAIYEETQQLRNLIDDLRTLSLADAGELTMRFENASPSDLLADIQRSFAVKAQQHGVTLKIEAAPDLPAVKIDRARMSQVLANLIHNALRYTPERGTITLKAARDGAGVALIVKDTGKGIPADKLPNLFQRFYRVEDDREQVEGQTGIGLAIVKALVEMHGGSVRAESAGLGQGASFMVQLPAT